MDRFPEPMGSPEAGTLACPDHGMDTGGDLGSSFVERVDAALDLLEAGLRF